MLSLKSAVVNISGTSHVKVQDMQILNGRGVGLIADTVSDVVISGVTVQHTGQQGGFGLAMVVYIHTYIYIYIYIGVVNFLKICTKFRGFMCVCVVCVCVCMCLFVCVCVVVCMCVRARVDVYVVVVMAVLPKYC